jgi:S-adenosylmethionine:tRNA ribosyltransferase-isomerase
MFSLSDYKYNLPDDRIAQFPVQPAHASKLLIHHADGHFSDQMFADVPALLPSHSVIFFNDSKVLPARVPLHHVRVITHV